MSAFVTRLWLLVSLLLITSTTFAGVKLGRTASQGLGTSNVVNKCLRIDADGDIATADGDCLSGDTLGAGDPSAAWPIGSVFISIVPTNPSVLLGFGTWSTFAAGRVLVGLDSGQTEFDLVEETGGAKTHTLTVAEMPTHTHTQDTHNHTQNAHGHTQDAHNHTQNSHNHTQDAHSHVVTSQTATTGSATSYEHGTLDTSSAETEATETTATTVATNQAATATNQNATATNQNSTATNQSATATNQNAGGDGAHNNLQPYVVVYMWKRIL